MTHRHPLLDENGDRRPLQLAILAAILVHVVVLYVTLPQPRNSVIKSPSVFVPEIGTRLPPPPPPKPPERIPPRELRPKKALIPIPDRTPDEPEPIREPEAEIAQVPPDLWAYPGPPTPPPVVSRGPLLPGIGGVSEPVRIHYVEPRFPPLARKAGVRGKVQLQANISETGTVSDLAVLYASPPDLGFEQAAMDAVRQWRYSPAEQDGKPVSVLLTVVIDFTLH
jgi:protein TonB